MRLSVLGLLLVGCADAPLVSAPTPSATDPWEDLVAESALHLGFEELSGTDGFVDDSPNGLVALAWEEDDLAARIVPGPRGNALAFDGIADFLYVVDSDVLDVAGPMTMLAWIRATPRTEGAPEWPIFDKYEYLDSAWTGYSAYLDGGQPVGGIYSGVETGIECGGARAGVFDDDVWHFFAATYDGAEVEVSVDGEVGARCDWTLDPLPNRAWVEVGTRGGEFYFLGALDDVTIVPRALSREELSELQ